MDKILNNNLQFTNVSLKQTLYESVDLKHGYNHAKFEKPHLKLNSVHKKDNVKVVVKSENMSINFFQFV